ncbi:MAG: MmcQ/YjbR family DNA-binding protein [Solirubrobacteraceae bacterium]
MPTWEDVVELGTRLPGVEVGTSFRTPALRVRGKGMCRLRSNPDALVLRVSDLGEREALLQGQPEVFFSTPHYDGYPYVLVRLEAVDPVELAELLEEAWRVFAAKRVVAAYDAQQRAPDA